MQCVCGVRAMCAVSLTFAAHPGIYIFTIQLCEISQSAFCFAICMSYIQCIVYEAMKIWK